jgi:hypothetical protein
LPIPTATGERNVGVGLGRSLSLGRLNVDWPSLPEASTRQEEKGGTSCPCCELARKDGGGLLAIVGGLQRVQRVWSILRWGISHVPIGCVSVQFIRLTTWPSFGTSLRGPVEPAAPSHGARMTFVSPLVNFKCRGHKVPGWFLSLLTVGQKARGSTLGDER